MIAILFDNGPNKPLESRNSALSSGSEKGGVNPVLRQKLSKGFVVSVSRKTSVMSSVANDMWHSIKVINNSGNIMTPLS